MSTLDAEILQAFPPKPLAASIFVDAQWHWNEYVHASQFVTACEGKSWNELALPFLIFHEDALRWLPPAAFVEIIPAYLSAALNLPRDADQLILVSLFMYLSRKRRWAHTFDARMDLLNQTQRKLMVTILETLPKEERDPVGYHDALDDLSDFPRDAAGPRMPDGPTTPVLPLPAQYAHLEQELLAAFPPQTFLPEAIAHWKVPRGYIKEYFGNTALEQAISGKVWGTLSIEFVCIHECALGLLKPAGFAALVPAYLAAFLHNKLEIPLSAYSSMLRSYEEDIEFAMRIETLDRAQRQVIVRVFEALKDMSERAIEPLSNSAFSIAWDIRRAYEVWCSVVNSPPNVETFSDPGRPPEFEPQQLLRQIREAFPSQLLSRDVFIQCVKPGRLGDDDKRFLDGLDGQSWNTLSPAFLRHYDTKMPILQELVPDAVVAVLPAYLEVLAYGDIYPMYILMLLAPLCFAKPDFDFMQRFNESQRRVIVHVLEAVAHESHPISRFKSEGANAALAHWRNVLS